MRATFHEQEVACTYHTVTSIKRKCKSMAAMVTSKQNKTNSINI